MDEIERTISIDKIDYNVDITKPDYSIEILPTEEYVIELNEQGPQGLPGRDGDTPEISIYPLSQEGYDITYRMEFSTGGYFDFTVTNGTGSLKWESISISDWVAEDSIYKLAISGSYGVVSVYRGNVSNRTKVDCDIDIIDNITYIKSINKFDGFVLLADITNPEQVGPYIYEQGEMSDTWIINHNLNTRPSITIVDTTGTIIAPNDIEYNNNNTITVYFLTGVEGKAYLNYTR